MSQPISECMMRRAVRDEQGYQELKESMRWNMECDHFGVIGCECDHAPSCGPDLTNEQLTILNARLKEDLKDVRFRGMKGMPCELGPSGPLGMKAAAREEYRG